MPVREIFREYDEYGPVQVLDDGQRRVLSFGEDDQQSIMLKAEPNRLLDDYTRAMLIGLLYVPEPEQALLLGLGGGCLLRTLMAADSSVLITAVELRQVVLKAARRYFQLPKSDRCQFQVSDALEFMEGTQHSYSLIFSDLYLAGGIATAQRQSGFITHCRRCLADEGMLVLNLWREHRVETEVLSALSEQFETIEHCYVKGGNWLLFASNAAVLPSKTELTRRAQQLARQLGFPILPSLKRLESLRLADT